MKAKESSEKEKIRTAKLEAELAELMKAREQREAQTKRARLTKLVDDPDMTGLFLEPLPGADGELKMAGMQPLVTIIFRLDGGTSDSFSSLWTQAVISHVRLCYRVSVPRTSTPPS